MCIFLVWVSFFWSFPAFTVDFSSLPQDVLSVFAVEDLLKIKSTNQNVSKDIQELFQEKSYREDHQQYAWIVNDLDLYVPVHGLRFLKNSIKDLPGEKSSLFQRFFGYKKDGQEVRQKRSEVLEALEQFHQKLKKYNQKNNVSKNPAEKLAIQMLARHGQNLKKAIIRREVFQYIEKLGHQKDMFLGDVYLGADGSSMTGTYSHSGCYYTGQFSEKSNFSDWNTHVEVDGTQKVMWMHAAIRYVQPYMGEVWDERSHAGCSLSVQGQQISIDVRNDATDDFILEWASMCQKILESFDFESSFRRGTLKEDYQMSIDLLNVALNIAYEYRSVQGIGLDQVVFLHQIFQELGVDMAQANKDLMSIYLSSK